MDQKQIEISGKKIVYRVAGEGAVVIFIHGFGEDGDVWKNQASLLAKQFRIIIPDLPGSGLSASVDDMSMEGLAEIIKTILEEEAITSCVMIGHSMGGYIGLAFAEKYAYMLKAFGLFQSTAFPDTAEKIINRRKGIQSMRDEGAFEFLKTATPKLFSQKTKEENPAIITELIDSLSNSTVTALVSYYEAMIARKDRTDFLRSCTIPILFVAGKYDVAVAADDVLRQCHLPSLSYIHILNNSGHMGLLEEPLKSNLILEKFLQYAFAI